MWQVRSLQAEEGAMAVFMFPKLYTKVKSSSLINRTLPIKHT